MRLGLGTALICVEVVALLSRGPDAITSVETVVVVAGGILLLIGLWTPLAGSLVALAETGQALAANSPAREAVLIHAFLAILSLGLAMLGPGAWSIDARLFGRQRFDLDRTRGGKP